MKRTLFVILIGFVFTGLFAQDKSAAELKNEGNAFIQKKKYAEALKSYEKYLSMIEEDDAATVYNCGICAYKAKKYDTAIKHFSKTIDLKYKKSATAYLYKSIVYKKQDDLVNYEKTLRDGIAAFPKGKDSDKMKGSLATHIAKSAMAEYNKGEKSKVAYINFSNDPNPVEKAKAEPQKVEATNFFNQALPQLEEAFQLDPTDKVVATALSNIYEFIGQDGKADKMKTLLETMP